MFAAAAAGGVMAKKYNLTLQDIIFAVPFAGGGIILGGMFLYALVQLPSVIAHREIFIQNLPGSLQIFWGMVFYGGLFGAVFGLFVYSKIIKQNFRNILYCTIPFFPLAHGIMRIGCFAAGCCYGIEHESLGVIFTHSPVAPNGISLIPVQLYEAALNFIIFGIMLYCSKKSVKIINLLCLYGLLYSIGRFNLEFLRGDEVRGFIFSLSTSQFISVILVIGCISTLSLYNFRSNRQKEA